MQNIVAAIFKTESEGYQAITELRQNPVTEKSAILQMGLVKRTDESFVICDGFDAGVISDSSTALGGLIGGLLGILGGPLGVLLLGSYGALAGSAAGAADSMDATLMLEKVASKMVEGEIALIALAEEKDEADLDGRLGKFDATIVRFDAAAVYAEVEEAEMLQLEENRQAFLDFKKEKRADHMERIEKKRKAIEQEFENYYDERYKTLQAKYT